MQLLSFEKTLGSGVIILEHTPKSPDFVKIRSIWGYKAPRTVDLPRPFLYDENGCFIAFTLHTKEYPDYVSNFSRKNKEI